MIIPSPHIYELSLVDNQVRAITDLHTNKKIEKFYRPLTSSQYKIYILTDKKKVLYIGTTRQSIKDRLRSGLSAEYYAYKWKNFKTVNLFVWCFEELNKDKIENIEAELAFIVRQTTGKWPDCQNEIHFNNSFGQTGKLIANELYGQLK